MVRLIVAAAIAALVGYGLGSLQFSSGYSGVDERLADLSIYDGSTELNASSEAPKPDSNKSKSESAIDSSAKAAKVLIPGGTTHDFGTMQQGGKKNHSFVFKNIGTAPMELKVAGSSCRCTIGTLKDSVLDPGEETAVELEWKATGVLDQFSQTATIITSDPDHRNVLLTVRGMVARTIIIEPSAINLGDIPVGQGARQSAFVFGYGDVPLEVKKAVWADERTVNSVDVHLVPIEVDAEKFPQHARANGAVRIDLHLKNGLPLGAISSRLVIDTNIENVTDVDLAVSGTVVGEIQFLPNPSFNPENSVLDFERVRQDTGATRKMFLSVQGEHRDQMQLEVGEVVPAASLKVSIGEPVRQQHRTIYPITCTVPEDAPPAMFPGTSSKNFGKVIIKTNHPDIPQMKLNLRLVVE